MINKLIQSIFGNKSQKDVRSLMSVVEQIKTIGVSFGELSNDELRQKTTEFRSKIDGSISTFEREIKQLKDLINEEDNVEQKEKYYEKVDGLEEKIDQAIQDQLSEILPAAFAVIKETARRFAQNERLEVTATESDRKLGGRDYISFSGDKAFWANSWDAAGTQVTWDMVHYDVQLIGGSVLHQGKIAEMATGEGKTLVATLPVYLNALSGRGVHVVTVNDYLAKRDTAWMAPIFEFHGLVVDCIDKYEPNSDQRRNAYMADITYGTNNEFGFDYLRDNMAHSPNELVQRKHNYAIVDEVDSVLIDDARTPLIISGPVPKGDRHEFNQLKPQVDKIVSTQRQYLNGILAEAKKLIAQGDKKQGGFLLYRVYRGLPKNKALIKFLSQEGIKMLLQKTENYHMQDNNKEMPKIDKELYFVIDEKNQSIELTDKGISFLSGDNKDDDFFILPDIGVEVTKIDKSDDTEERKAELKNQLYQNFSVKSERIHTMNQLLKAYTLFERDIEYVLVEGRVKIVDEQTGRIMEGRRYSDGLHQAIEAKENVKIEAATQTFATITLQNYFRMYKKLSGMTGTAETEAQELWQIYKLDVVVVPTNEPIQRDDRNDLVYKTKREKYNAVIQEVVTLSKEGRPVLVGTTSVEISELLGRALKMQKIPHNILNAKLHRKEADVVAEAGESGKVTIATNMAGRGTDIKLSEDSRQAGGLAIVGTERHDSRRVDRQLRGRSGRQGDVGSSQFFVSLEDDLMRLFGSERIAKLMDRMGHKEGDVIQHSMISRSIERAQKKIEENNFGIRKRLLEYDDVMNTQREVIYKRRYHALFGERLSIDIFNMIYEICRGIVDVYRVPNDYSTFEGEVIRMFSVSPQISEGDYNRYTSEDLVNAVYSKCCRHYQHKCNQMIEQSYEVISKIYKNSNGRYERIAVPFTDGIKEIQIVTNLKKSYETNCKQLLQDFQKNIVLAIIDDHWKNHLRAMDDLKQSVQNAVYEQKDPLLIYKFESFELFKSMMSKMGAEIVNFLFKATLPQLDEGTPRIADVDGKQRRKKEKLSATKEDFLTGNTQGEQEKVTNTPIVNRVKIGRNERVDVQNISTGEQKNLKYKQALPLIEQGDWVLLERG